VVPGVDARAHDAGDGKFLRQYFEMLGQRSDEPLCCAIEQLLIRYAILVWRKPSV
jgi:hypothetical protein